MLDDDAGGLVEHAHTFHRGVRVGDIVERQLLALEHARRGDAGAAGRRSRGRTRRAGAGSHRNAGPALSRTPAAGSQGTTHPRSPRGRAGTADTMVSYFAVCANALAASSERVSMLVAPSLASRSASTRAIIRRIDDDGDRFVIFRRGAHHRRPADVDVLDRFGVCAVGPGDGRGEWIKVHRQQVDARDVVFLHDGIVDAAPAQQAAVHARMQRLDAPVHDFGEAGVRADVDHREARVVEGSVAVPPVLRISTFRATRARAKSTSPVLSETDSRALLIVTSIEVRESARKAELPAASCARFPG